MSHSVSRRARLKHLLTQTRWVAHVEFSHFQREAKLRLAALVVAIIPSIYLLIYLSSVWDPSARSTSLPVGLVNLDQGFTYREKTLNIGNDLISGLQHKKQLGYQNFDNEAQARERVRQGKLAFALIIPRDFSANAVPGLQAGQGRLVVYTSAGNNYESSVLASQFAKALGEEVNQTLNEQRWSLVLSASAGSQQSVDRLRSGMTQLRNGALELANGTSKAELSSVGLHQGATRLQDGVQRLADGTAQLGGGIRSMEASLPPIDDVRNLRTGAEALASGHQELDKGLQELRLGSQRMAQSVSHFKTEADSNVFVPSAVADGLDRVRQGAEQLDQGLGQAQEGQQKLSQGAATLSNKIRTLTFGVRDMRAGLRSMTGKLPEDSQLDQLRNGSLELARGTSQLHDGLQRLREGSHYLSAGIDLMTQELPSSVGSIEGSPEGLAHSVTPILEVDAEVANHGSGFAPNIIPVSLWLGAGIAAFLVHLRLLPRMAQSFSPWAQFLGKVSVPASVCLLQATLVLLTVCWVLDISVRHPAILAVMLALASLTFVCIVYALTRAFGDAGKALAMLFLALQVSASGGLLPVELSGSLYAHISPWLPMTWVVMGVKACMFHAFEGDWYTPMLVTLCWGVASAWVACFAGQWRFVPVRRMRPLLDV
ncbi:hypothetical protein B9Z39_10705 [Limnohabitans sp. JirII-29]|uniref:YhgE/Pip domain-containing protein n=1 Tax=Limnohabitans sp. JirII-29 TaxID=1835756 RepID=UPI000D348E7F|nr:YhgE/Pip domain-containing protein [Limnohabitans sp. JirII-29]PUE26208.1 hypothetical protein B9Z39_10705 [Limnohabitans sp. JirII-29]